MSVEAPPVSTNTQVCRKGYPGGQLLSFLSHNALHRCANILAIIWRTFCNKSIVYGKPDKCFSSQHRTESNESTKAHIGSRRLRQKGQGFIQDVFPVLIRDQPEASTPTEWRD